MLARRTTTALVGLTVFTHAFQLPRHALRPTRRRAADDDDDFDFEAAFKARVEEVQSIDVVEAVFGDEGPPLDLEKMAALGKEAAGVGVAAIAGAFLLLFSSLFFTQSKSPAEGAARRKYGSRRLPLGEMREWCKKRQSPRVHVRPLRRRPQRGARGKPGAALAAPSRTSPVSFRYFYAGLSRGSPAMTRSTVSPCRASPSHRRRLSSDLGKVRAADVVMVPF